MSTRNRRLATSASSSSSSTARRPPIMAGNQSKKMGASKTQITKKRAALSDITNQGNGSLNGSRAMLSHSKPLVPCTSKIAKKKETSNCTQGNGLSTNTLPTPLSLGPCANVLSVQTTWPRDDQATVKASGLPSPSCMHSPCISISPCRSLCGSVSLDETMSTCDSLQSPDLEYVENENVSEVKSIERKANSKLYICTQKEGKICKRNILSEMGQNDNAVGFDDSSTDPQHCALIARDVYKSARASESKKRPSMDFMEIVQKDINSSMRAILVDWLVEVTEEYRLIPETLFLAVNYIDRYLSGNSINRQQLQLLGVACMMIASKYEEICAPQVEEFCYVTDNTYCKDEILQMESAVLNYLKFEMAVPTVNFFLRQFVHAVQMITKVESLQFECLANYIAELSLLEYTMLHYAPSLVAASAAFLAKFILSPSKKPWDSMLGDYTQYQPSDMSNCVKALHQLCRNGGRANLPAIREKYSQHKYKFVAKKYCPASIPLEFLEDASR